jgi:peptidoglycan pentaglycine glycine transferase (the first glycine)
MTKKYTMNLLSFSQADQDKYESFIAAARGSFLQSWQWGEFQNSLKQKVVRVGLKNDNQLLIVAQFIEQTIPHLNGKYLYCPFGPVGNLHLIGDLIAQLQEQNPHLWFIRIEPNTDCPAIGQPTLRIQPGKTLVTNLSKTEDELLADMHPKTRYNIKVAQKHGIQIEILNSNDADEALQLISDTSKRQGFTDHPQSYYQNLIKHFSEGAGAIQLKIYCTRYQNKLLNSAIMLDYQNTRTYLFGGSSGEHKNLMAPYLLHWQAMQGAKTAGLKNYDWWGIETASGKTPGFARFKLGWSGEQISYPTPQDIVAKPAHYQIYKLLRAVNRLF